MNRLVPWAMVLALAAPVAADAASITYVPTGTFSTSGTNEVMFTTGSGASLTTVDILFTPNPASVDPGTTLLGTFNVTVTGPGTVNIPSSPAPTFLLSINQATPTVGMGSFPAATMAGFASAGGTKIGITFSNPTLVIGPVTYQLQNLTNDPTFGPNTLRLGLGATQLSALVTAVPEPGSMALTVVGGVALGLAGVWRKRPRDAGR